MATPHCGFVESRRSHPTRNAANWRKTSVCRRSESQAVGAASTGQRARPVPLDLLCSRSATSRRSARSPHLRGTRNFWIGAGARRGPADDKRAPAPDACRGAGKCVHICVHIEPQRHKSAVFTGDSRHGHAESESACRGFESLPRHRREHADLQCSTGVLALSPHDPSDRRGRL
jgi:hypothetical protein